MAEILDSGDRTQFPSGAVRDMREGKGRFDVMPLEVVAEMMHDSVIHDIAYFMHTNDTTYLYRALCRFALDHYMNEGNKNQPMNTVYADMCLDVAVHYEQGAKKYGPDNWRKSIPVWCYIDSAVRHYMKVLRGDTDEPHAKAFVWNIMCCIWEVDHNKKESNDA